MHEPLIFGFCFPFHRNKPWSVRSTPKLLELERSVQALWKGSRLDGRSDLHKLLLDAWKLPTMPNDVVQHLLYFRPRDPVSLEVSSSGG